MRRGFIVLAVFPYSDLSGFKVRPALVVGFASDGDVILAFITSQQLTPTHAVCRIDTSDDEFISTGLKVSSTIRLDKLVTLDHRLVRRRLGTLGPTSMQRVTNALRFVFRLDLYD